MRVLIGVETAVLVLLSILVAGLLRSHAEILRALHSLGVRLDDGENAAPTAVRAPAGRTTGRGYDVAGVTPDDAAVHVGVLGGRQATLLAFLSTGCTTCEPFWDGLRRGEPRLPDRARVVAVTRGPGHESPARLRALAPPGVPVVMSDAAWDDYAVTASPYFVYVAGDRVVGEGAAQGWPQLRSLLARAEAEGGHGGPGNGEARVDRELRVAGIAPHDARLHHRTGPS